MKTISISMLALALMSSSAFAAPTLTEKLAASKAVQGLLKGVEAEWSVTCSLTMTGPLKDSDPGLLTGGFSAYYSCLPNDPNGEYGVYIQINGTDAEEIILIEKIEMGYAG